MAVLVVAEHDNASVKDATNKTVTAALALSSDVDVLVAGLSAGAAASAAAGIAGVRKSSTLKAQPLIKTSLKQSKVSLCL